MVKGEKEMQGIGGNHLVMVHRLEDPSHPLQAMVHHLEDPLQAIVLHLEDPIPNLQVMLHLLVDPSLLPQAMVHL